MRSPIKPTDEGARRAHDYAMAAWDDGDLDHQPADSPRYAWRDGADIVILQYADGLRLVVVVEVDADWDGERYRDRTKAYVTVEQTPPEWEDPRNELADRMRDDEKDRAIQEGR